MTALSKEIRVDQLPPELRRSDIPAGETVFVTVETQGERDARLFGEIASDVGERVRAAGYDTPEKIQELLDEAGIKFDTKYL